MSNGNGNANVKRRYDGDLLGRNAMELLEKIKPHVGRALEQHLDQMGPSSLFNLACAIAALQAQGPGGTVTIRVPSKLDDRVEVDWQPHHNIS